MPSNPELLKQIGTALGAFDTAPLPSAARDLLRTLGYASDRSLPIGSVDAFCRQFDPAGRLDHPSALKAEWKSIHLLFQLTDQELSRQNPLFKDTTVQPGLFQSYVFFALELKGGDYARGKLTGLVRQLNRIFPMPVMVLIKHLAGRQPVLSIAVINRRRHKLDAAKDVLEKATIIRDISVASPHRGHLDILSSLALPNLVHPQKKPITDFDTLHAAWEQIFNVELLNERFYRELANWYFWTLPQVEFPADLEPDDEKRRATGLIRLLTRLIFCWFLKEKGLIPEKLFHPTDLAKLLKGFDSESKTSSTYYQAILQNLFFATLNQRMGRDNNGKSYRRYITPGDYQGKNREHGITNLFRYPELFQTSDLAPALFEDIPFLNGGLFECLDREDPSDKNRMLRLDGFTTKGVRPQVADRLFFAHKHQENLSGKDAYNDPKRKDEEVSGLIHILNRYKFTIVENTPIDQEIALDPELLGKVFENLLASYNEETKTTARKQTGSFYTPRPIVDYMVDESLKAHLTRALAEKARMKEPDARAGLDLLFAYTEKAHAFTPAEVATLIAAIDALKILDPACGSGAFPMGVLHKLVYILGKLDPDNERWKQTQLAKLDSAPMREELERAFADNNDDYGRKLYLIENCLYGVDIQPIAIQITKLRFFISLVCDQKTNRNKKENHGIRPLPNLETKFVAADTLIGLPEMTQSLLVDPRIGQIEKEIETLYHGHFSIQRRDHKLNLQRKIKSLRQDLAKLLAESLMAPKKAEHVAKWDAFDPQSTADFFDPHWMFGRSLATGFDIVLGNPPYISVERFAGTAIQEMWQERFETFAQRGDIYCFFYERGLDLLRIDGTLIYITSNKWMRTSYGKKLRSLFATKVRVLGVLDFGMGQNFGAATTYTCITSISKEPPRNGGEALLCYATESAEAISNPKEYFLQHAVPLKLSASEWVVMSNERAKLKEQVARVGKPLSRWNLEISSGIKTSHNDAFIVDADKYKDLVMEDSSSAKMLHPILRGEDVKRYHSDWKAHYVIGTFKQLRETYHLDDFPAIKRHLMQFKRELEPQPPRWNSARDGKWPGRNTQPFDYLWYEVFFAPDLAQFRQPKIMYPNMTKFMPFYLDKMNHWFCNQKAFVITGDGQPLEFLTAFFNSSIFRCCFKDNFPELLGNTYELSKKYFKDIPVLEVSEGQAQLFAPLVELVQFAKLGGHNAAGAFLEDLIDACVMECYFREHMAERDLLFHDTVAPHLAAYAPEASEVKQRDFLTHLHQTINAPSHPVRNRLLRLTADSPDLLAVIKQEGKV
ncbi:MAG: Eco57I restriction-modification methylase domain-containing protein [Fimbriimonadaceae bacterium]|nr:Eco57I restriction-modification methylase domain-containing protein [Opitutaceae bacterium]MCC6687149.1 Eco57I restriction-modification methylase domain-containing protein [Fimbriimonadaceae bacterium]